MKLFIVTCLKEYLGDISKIFKRANIDVFSTSNIIGHREGQPLSILEDWFASGGEQVDSLMIFTFTSDTNASLGMQLIEKYNEQLLENFPVRAFIMSVDKSTN
ncbi:hypothetical protein BH09BAC6_BH09BAC6_33380 [soil metagenome]|jgi:hypothetical protein